MSTIKSATRYSADNNTRTLAKKPSANHVDFGSMVRKLIDTKKSSNPEKADNYGGRGYSDTRFISSKTPSYDQGDEDSLFDHEEEDYMAPKSADSMFLKDFNPCLTPPLQAKSNELRGNESTALKLSSHENRISAFHGKVSESTEQCRSSKGPRKSKDNHESKVHGNFP